MRLTQRKNVVLELRALEDRTVPANNLTVVDDLTGSFNLHFHQTGSTLTVLTSGADARVAIGDIHDYLTMPGVSTVELTTEAHLPVDDANQNGDIVWNADVVDSNLYTLDIGLNKTLKFITDSSGTNGDIILTSPAFATSTGNTLSLEFDSSATNGNISFLAGLNPVNVLLPGNGNLTISAGTGNFLCQTGAFGGYIEANDVTINGGMLDLGEHTYTANNNLTVTGTAITLTSTYLHSKNDITVTGPVTLSGFNYALSLGGTGTLTFSSTIDGAGLLTVDSKTITFNGAIGTTTPLSELVHQGGELNFGANTVSVGAMNIGSGFAGTNSPAIMSGSGTITATITVYDDGHINPGGVGTIATLDIVGNLNFDGGSYSPDLGASADLLNITGNLDLSNGKLGDHVGVGLLANPSATILTYSGTLTGEFTNAGTNIPLVVGTDAVQVTDYTTNSEITIAPLTGATTSGSDQDGTGYTIKITGDGELVTFNDANFQPSVVVRNASPATTLTITTKAASSDELVTFNDIVVNGGLAKFKAKKVDINSSLRTTALLRSATFHDLLPGALVESGGTLSDQTTLKAHRLWSETALRLQGALTTLQVTESIAAQIRATSLGKVTAVDYLGDIITPGAIGTVKLSGDYLGTIRGTALTSLEAVSTTSGVFITGDVKSIKTTNDFSSYIEANNIDTLSVGNFYGVIESTGTLKRIKVARDSFGHIAAGAIGTANIGGTLSNSWHVLDGIKSLSTSAILSFTLDASFLETLTVKANPKLSTRGEISNSEFYLSGNNGIAGGEYGLKKVVVSGTIQGSIFDIQEGNVASFTTGRFINSQLYLDYASLFAFNIGGAFGGGSYKLGSFKTTASDLGDPTQELNWAFSHSEIAASQIGTVELSGLRTDFGGTAFGIKYQEAGAVIKVKAAGPSVVNPLAPGNLSAGFNVDDFFVLHV